MEIECDLEVEDTLSKMMAAYNANEFKITIPTVKLNSGPNRNGRIYNSGPTKEELLKKIKKLDKRIKSLSYKGGQNSIILIDRLYRRKFELEEEVLVNV